MKLTLQIFFLFLICSFQGLFAQYGTLDTNFGENGKVTTAFNFYYSSIQSMSILSDGKILTVGTIFNDSDFSQFALVRYTSDGRIDTTFGNNGKVISNFTESKIGLESMLVQSDGKIVLAGIIYNSFTNSQFVLVRYTKNGDFDTTFGNNGVVLKGYHTINSITLQEDDKIVVAGFSFENNVRDYSLIRYTVNGVQDTSFGNNGTVSLSIGDRDFWYDVVLKSDEKIVVVGSAKNNSGNYDSDFAIMQFNKYGTLDANFGENGIVIIDYNDVDAARAVKIQNDGKIVFVGWSYSTLETIYDYKMVRLLLDGSLDESFGEKGMLSIPISINLSSESIEIQSDQKILVTGFVSKTDKNDIALCRVNSNGAYDSTFGNDGVVTTTFQASSQANSIVCQPDGLIVVGGEAAVTAGIKEYSPNFALLRYTSGKVLDSKKFSQIQNAFFISRNDSNGEFYLNFHLDETEIISMNLYDVNGRIIKEVAKQKPYPKGYSTQNLELTNTLSNGLYFLNITNGRNSLTIKIIK